MIEELLTGYHIRLNEEREELSLDEEKLEEDSFK